jgi:hypothetical protein
MKAKMLPNGNEAEIAQQRDSVIKRMLATPPQKHKDVPKRRQPDVKPGR